MAQWNGGDVRRSPATRGSRPVPASRRPRAPPEARPRPGADRQGDAGLRDRVQARPVHQRLVPDAAARRRRARHGRRRAGHRRRRGRRRRGRAPGRHDHLRHWLRDPQLRRPDGDPRARRRELNAVWASGRRPTWAPPSPAFRTCSSSTARTPTTARARSPTRSSPSSTTSSTAISRLRDGGSAGSTCARRRRRRGGPRWRERSADTVWTTGGCHNWYVNSQGREHQQLARRLARVPPPHAAHQPRPTTGSPPDPGPAAPVEHRGGGVGGLVAEPAVGERVVLDRRAHRLEAGARSWAFTVS